jgi:hypothetical protein
MSMLMIPISKGTCSQDALGRQGWVGRGSSGLRATIEIFP